MNEEPEYITLTSSKVSLGNGRSVSFKILISIFILYFISIMSLSLLIYNNNNIFGDYIKNYVPYLNFRGRGNFDNAITNYYISMFILILIFNALCFLSSKYVRSISKGWILGGSIFGFFLFFWLIGADGRIFKSSGFQCGVFHGAFLHAMTVSLSNLAAVVVAYAGGEAASGKHRRTSYE